MGAGFLNAMVYLVRIGFYIAISLFIARILLQVVRADFYNPLSQMIWRATQAIAAPLQRVLPRMRGRIDPACSAILLLLAMLYIVVLNEFVFHYDLGLLGVLRYAIQVIVWQTLELYFLSMFVQAILSWVGPGVSNPAANILWSLNEPVLRPLRRILPSIQGVDIAPLVAMIAIRVIVLLFQLPGGGY